SRVRRCQQRRQSDRRSVGIAGVRSTHASIATTSVRSMGRVLSAKRRIDMSVISQTEQQELCEREARIEHSLSVIEENWIIVAQEMRAIRERKLYRITHKTFEEYCRERWHKSIRRIEERIQYEGVWRDIENTVFVEDEMRGMPRVFSPPLHE